MALDGAVTPSNWVVWTQQIRNGDEAGIADLYAALVPPLRARLSRVVSPEEIEDRLQEVLVIVLEAIRSEELRDPGRLPGFVSTVTRRQMAAHIRGQIIRRQRFVEQVDRVQSLDQSPEERAARRERVEQLARFLRRLNARDREILERFYLLEQNVEQICQEMLLTETQFRLFKSRAIARCFDLARRRAARPPARSSSPGAS